MPLTAPASRAALYRRGAKGLPKALAVCALAFMVLLGLLLAVLGWTKDDRAAVLDAGRVETVATVTEAESRWDENEVGEDVIVSDIVFTYEAKGGGTHTGSATMRGYDRDWRPGHTLPVWYAEARPSLSEVKPGHHARNESALGILAWVFGGPLAALPVLLGAALAWSPWSTAGALTAARDRGQAREAVVQPLTRDDVRHGREGHLRWQAKDLPPATSAFPVPDDARPAEGETITIYRLDDAQVWEGEVGPPAC